MAGRKPVGPQGSVRLSPEMWAEVDHLAAAFGLTRSSALRKVIKAGLVAVKDHDYGEPEPLASLPREVRALVHAVDRIRARWAEADEKVRAELWREMHEANDAVWIIVAPLQGPVILYGDGGEEHDGEWRGEKAFAVLKAALTEGER